MCIVGAGDQHGIDIWPQDRCLGIRCGVDGTKFVRHAVGTGLCRVADHLQGCA